MRADEITALVGVQPKFTQDPPRCSRSARPTRLPAFVKACASGIPAWPAPIINTSNLGRSLMRLTPSVCKNKLNHGSRYLPTHRSPASWFSFHFRPHIHTRFQPGDRALILISETVSTVYVPRDKSETVKTVTQI